MAASTTSPVPVLILAVDQCNTDLTAPHWQLPPAQLGWCAVWTRLSRRAYRAETGDRPLLQLHQVLKGDRYL